MTKQTAEEFENGGYRYSPEDAITLHGTKGRVWSRWEAPTRPGGGYIFMGRMFVPGGEKSNGEVIEYFDYVD